MKKSVFIALAFTLLALPLAAATDAAALFQSKCNACHSKTRNLGTAEVQAKTDDQLTAKIKGHGAKVKGLTDDDVKALVTYIRTLKK